MFQIRLAIVQLKEKIEFILTGYSQTVNVIEITIFRSSVSK